MLEIVAHHDALWVPTLSNSVIVETVEGAAIASQTVDHLHTIVKMVTYKLRHTGALDLDLHP